MNLECPILENSTLSERITIGHGGGGSLTSKLINEVFHPNFTNEYLDAALDGAVVPAQRGNLAISTDSFVVSPLFFNGGNIGDLAINGTSNDIICCGAIPRFISAGFIIEEGFEISKLMEIAQTMRIAAKKAGVKIVTADTKVVERGKCDSIYINTTGIGWIVNGISLAPQNVKVGDSVIITGSIGNHGIAIMSERNGIEFTTPVKSDSASLVDMAQNLFINVPQIHEMRDPTRGGLSSTLNEIASTAGITITINESALPIEPEVQSACDMLGLDPLYVANEGSALVFVPAYEAEHALDVIRKSKHGAKAQIIGSVNEKSQGRVILEMPLGQKRLLLPFTGEQLPRIC